MRAQEFDISGEAEAARQRAAAGLAQQQFQAGLLGGQERAQQQALSGLLGIGGLQQALQQQALGAARSEFDRALQYPGQQFGFLTQAINKMPFGQTVTGSEIKGTQDRILSGLGGLQQAFGSIGSLLPEPYTGF